jgi:predicted transcriptional regulator YheO
MSRVSQENKTPFLLCFEPIVDCIADLLGPNCEVVLHDISCLEHSIIKIRNGHITGRKVGDTMTDLGLKQIKEAEQGLTLLGNYNPKTKTGRILKSNAITLRDPNGKIVGTLCINIDVSKLIQLEQEIRNFYKAENKEDGKPLEERYEENIVSIVQGIISDAIEEKGIPVFNLKRKDRIELIKKLDNRGLFLLKGAVLQVSESLGISASMVYKYLEEIRFHSEEAKKSLSKRLL